MATSTAAALITYKKEEVRRIWMRGYGRGYSAGQRKGKSEIAKGVIELLDLGEFFEKVEQIASKAPITTKIEI